MAHLEDQSLMACLSILGTFIAFKIISFYLKLLLTSFKFFESELDLSSKSLCYLWAYECRHLVTLKMLAWFSLFFQAVSNVSQHGLNAWRNLSQGKMFLAHLTLVVIIMVLRAEVDVILSSDPNFQEWIHFCSCYFWSFIL